MVFTPLIVILAQVALQSDLRSGCSSQVRRWDMARSTPPPFLVKRSSRMIVHISKAVWENFR